MNTLKQIAFGYFFVIIIAGASAGLTLAAQRLALPLWLDVLVWMALTPFILLGAVLYFAAIFYMWIGRVSEDKSDEK